MSLGVNVKGGTDGGRRAPFNGRAPEWGCLCAIPVCCGYFEDGGCCGDPYPEQKGNPGYLSRCPDCGERRPS